MGEIIMMGEFKKLRKEKPFSYLLCLLSSASSNVT